MRAGFLAVVVCNMLAFSGMAHAQKSVLPGHPTTPPPMMRPMPSPDLSPSLSLPSAVAPSVVTPAPVPSAPAASGGGPSCHPYNCDTAETNENARHRYAQCVEQARRTDRLIDKARLEDCVFGWMSPSKFSAFRQCWYGPNATAWDCFRSAYF